MIGILSRVVDTFEKLAGPGNKIENIRNTVQVSNKKSILGVAICLHMYSTQTKEKVHIQIAQNQRKVHISTSKGAVRDILKINYLDASISLGYEGSTSPSASC